MSCHRLHSPAPTVAVSYFDQVALWLSNALFDPLTASYDPHRLASLLFWGLALGTIVFGSYSTIQRPPNALCPLRSDPLFDPSDCDLDVLSEGEAPTISVMQAATAPVWASALLVGLYYGMRYLDPAQLSRFMNWYLIVCSVAANSCSYGYMITASVRVAAYRFGFNPLSVLGRYRVTVACDEAFQGEGVPLGGSVQLSGSTGCVQITAKEPTGVSGQASDVKSQNQLFNWCCTSGDWLALMLALATSYVYALYNGSENYLLSNLIGTNLAVLGIQSIKLGGFQAGVVLLVGLFVYDVYFVFGADTMMTVASSLSIPAKLALPNLSGCNGAAVTSMKKMPVSMLGLGDIVVPGIFAASCLRFDVWRYHEYVQPQSEFHHLNRFPKPYFTAALWGYTLGFAVTVAMLEIFNVAQPALLYLVPFIIGSVLLTAYFKGELVVLWGFTESADPVGSKTPCDLAHACATLSGNDFDDDYNEEDDSDYTDHDSECDSDGDTVVLYESDEENIVAMSDDEINFFKAKTVMRIKSTAV